MLDHKTRGSVHSSCSGMKLGHALPANRFGRRKAGGEALRVDPKIAVEVQPRGGCIPDRDRTVVAAGAYLSFTIGRDDEAPFALGIVTPQNRILGHSLNGDDFKRPSRCSVAGLSRDVAVKQTLLAKKPEANRGKRNGVSLGQSERFFHQSKGSVGERGFAERRTTALA